MAKRAALLAVSVATLLGPPAAADTPALMQVFFAPGSTTLSPQAAAILDNIVLAIGDSSAVPVAIRGHSDRVGSEERNLRLSRQRAERVRDYLIARGVSAAVIRAVEGVGEADLMVPTADGVAEPVNRRVQVAWGPSASWLVATPR